MEVDLHMHSEHSNDSRSKVKDIVVRAIGLGLGAIAVTDHDSWEGCREAAKLADGKILIVPGAELKTEKGDVLALFITEEIRSRVYRTVIDDIRSRGGISIVPHPGDSPKLTPDDLRLADGLECFNSTCTRRSNARAARIVAELGKPGFASSDAHLVMEIGNGRTKVPDCSSLDELKNVILKNPLPTKMQISNLLIHRTNEAINFGFKGIWKR